MKKCTKCGRELDESCFTLQRKGGTTLRSQCKDCVREYAKQHLENKRMEQSERNISLKITNNKINNIFCITNLKDIPSKVKKGIKIPKKLSAVQNKPSLDIFKLRTNIINVMRRSRGVVHISQIQVAYYRMFNEVISSRTLSVQLGILKNKEAGLSHTSRGYYEYKRED